MSTTASDIGNNIGLALIAALDHLDLTALTHDPENLHRVRVAVKQTRAWLKLCHGMTGRTPAYQQLQDNLRTLSNGLSGQRDQDVALLTLVKLSRKYPGKKVQQLIELVSQRFALRPSPKTNSSLMSNTCDQIRQDLLPYAQQAIPQAIQRKVLSRTYAKMCKIGKAALKSQNCAELHAWRKQVKTLGYQLMMVDCAYAHSRSLSARMTRLGSKLGDLHDLCFLQVLIEETAGQLQSIPDLTPLLKRIAKERERLIGIVRKQDQQMRDIGLHFSS